MRERAQALDAGAGLAKAMRRGRALTPMRYSARYASRPDGRERKLRKNAFEESPGSTRIRRRVTPAQGNLRESATENRPPSDALAPAGKGETVG